MKELHTREQAKHSTRGKATARATATDISTEKTTATEKASLSENAKAIATPTTSWNSGISEETEKGKASAGAK